MSSIVTDRGQITINRAARDALGIRPGMRVVQIVVGDHLEVHFLPAEHEDSLLGILKVDPHRDYSDWDGIMERASTAIARDAMKLGS